MWLLAGFDAGKTVEIIINLNVSNYKYSVHDSIKLILYFKKKMYMLSLVQCMYQTVLN